MIEKKVKIAQFDKIPEAKKISKDDPNYIEGLKIAEETRNHYLSKKKLNYKRLNKTTI